MTVEIPPMHLEITSTGVGYKSIKHLRWVEIPGFAIITGPNGSGKTQLLEVLNYHITGAKPRSDAFDVAVNIDGKQYEADQVGHVPSDGRFAGSGISSIAELENHRRNFLQDVNNKESHQDNPATLAKIRRIDRYIAGRDWYNETENGQKSLDEDEFSVFLEVDVTISLATIFVDHRVRMVEANERGTPGLGKDGKPLGPPPWDVVNDLLQVAGFVYEVVRPTTVGLTERYKLQVQDKVSGKQIEPIHLSSGEKVLFQLALWLFGSAKEGVFAKLLLLDEPDAHLHPSMTAEFLDAVSEVLVKKHGIRVIMTTHSPSTVALAPEGAVFEMERGGDEVRPVTDRAAIISVLTAGLVTVSPTTRFCFVEDENDVNFYNAVWNILTDAGPSKDPRGIQQTPSLVFLAASIGRGDNKMSGGKSIVEKWIEKLDAPPLSTTFFGVIDRDVNNLDRPRIKVIGRYSLENYLLDPVNVYGLLVANGTAPTVSGVKITAGDEHRLRDFPDADLQAIADVITSKVQIENPTLAPIARIEVTYTRGNKVEVPEWVICYRGHDLLPKYQAAWGGAQTITPPRLTHLLGRIRLVPLELASLYVKLQS